MKYRHEREEIRPPSPTIESRKKAGESIRIRMSLGLIPKPPRPTAEAYKRAGLKMRGSLNARWIADRTKLKLKRFNCSERKGMIDSWRRDILIRDDFVCIKCGNKRGELRVHHIFNWADFPEKRYDNSNGIILCKKCHTKFHSTYGYRKTNQEQLKEYLNYRENNYATSQAA